MKIRIRVGKKIKELRQNKNISLTALSEKSGVQIATLSRIENDKMTGTIETHALLAKALNVGLDEIFKDMRII